MKPIDQSGDKPDSPLRARVSRPRTRHPSAGPGMGTGWGGPAKGGGGVVIDIRRPGNKPTRAVLDAKKARIEAAIQEAMDVIGTIMRTGEREETKLSAAKALLDRLEGQPVARNVNADMNDTAKLSDEELHAEQARIARALTGT